LRSGIRDLSRGLQSAIREIGMLSPIQSSDRANEFLFLAVLAALGLGCAAGLYLAIAQIPLHVVLDPNEGWNAYFAQAAATHGALYPAPPSLMVNNYPPLSFLIFRGAGVTDFVIAGRMISLIGFLAITVLILEIAGTAGSGRREAVFAALFLSALILLGSDYVGMDDPQLFGHAIDLAALRLVLTRERLDWPVALAALQFVIAGLIKHNLFVLPLATAVWLYFHDRRAATTFVAIGAGLALLSLVWFRFTFGSDLLAHLDSPRTYSLASAANAIWSWLGFALVPVIGLVLLVVLDRKNPFVQLVALWAGIGIVVGGAFSGGAGVDVNAMFDADIALALSSALLLTRLSQRGRTFEGLAAAALVTPLAIALSLAASPDWLTRDFWLRPGADDAETAGRNIAFLESHPGPALCESLSLCYWAGKKAEVDVFNLGEAYKTGARSDNALVRLLEDKHYAVVQFETPNAFPLTARVRGAVLANYRIDHIDDDGIFLVRK
jgi:hypothetical protein